MDINHDLKTLYRIFPPFLFGEALINLSTRPALDQLYGTHTNGFDWDVAGRALVLLLVEAVAWFSFAIGIDSGLFHWAWENTRKQLRRLLRFRAHPCPKLCGKVSASISVEMDKVKRIPSATSILKDLSQEDEDVSKERIRVNEMVTGKLFYCTGLVTYY